MKSIILIFFLTIQLINCDNNLNSTYLFNSSSNSSVNVNLTVSNINSINSNQDRKINLTILNENSTDLINRQNNRKLNLDNSSYIDIESTTVKIEMTTLSDLSNSNEITTTELSKSSVNLNASTEKLGNSLVLNYKNNNKTLNNSLNFKSEIDSITTSQNGTTLSLDNSRNISTIDIYVTRNSTNNYAITTTEIKKSNQTLLSAIILRLHNFVQYSSNFSSQAVIPYVYLAKIQFDGMYRQVVESTNLHNYMTNIFNLIVNDLMNKECNVLSSMLNYLVIPIAETNGPNYVFQQTRELVDDVYRWHTAFQRWSSQLSSIFYQIAELRIEDCGQKLLCSLGKAKYRSLREEPRMNRSKIIQFLNNLFNMPILEKRLKRSYLEARQYGASGGNCDQVTTNCFMPTENFDNLINLAKQLF